ETLFMMTSVPYGYLSSSIVKEVASLGGDVDAFVPEPVKLALKDAKKQPSDIDEIILVGGSTRIPRVQEEVKKFFGKEPNRSVNPDEVVAIGAAVQAGVLSGEVKDILLLDVTPLSLGVETLGGVMTKLIERNTTIPTRKTEIFSTAADGQTQVEIHVLQGEREMASDNRTLGRFILDGIPPAPRGVPQIEVTFDIDANGILNVSARDKATGREQKITITASSGLTKEEIEAKVREAQQHAEEDKKRRERVEIRNRGDQLVYQTEKTLKEYKEKLPADVASEIESKLEALKETLKKDDTDEIKRASDELMKSAQKMGEALYRDFAQAGQSQGAQAAGGANPQQGAGQTSTTDGDVIDAEFKESKD
ncbi:MAG: molecular chaperone DnaK, partial [Deltaproteobacteria bacterium]